jgi:hypothetical protein
MQEEAMILPQKRDREDLEGNFRENLIITT